MPILWETIVPSSYQGNAWLYLDFGIETCFYGGMDAYSKTWLQFVFPVYVWMVVGLIILISHFSQRFANLLGNNPVSVLATLTLLSYAKVLCTFITAVSFIDIEYHAVPSVALTIKTITIELSDECGKHVPNMAMLVFFFLFLPYTILLPLVSGRRT